LSISLAFIGKTALSEAAIVAIQEGIRIADERLDKHVRSLRERGKRDGKEDREKADEEEDRG
jgi:hypothetical protein